MAVSNSRKWQSKIKHNRSIDSQLCGQGSAMKSVDQYTGIVGALKRRVAPDQTVNALSARARNRKPPKAPQIPKVVELLRTAQEWRRQLDAGDVTNQAEIARREGITRARVTQIMALIRQNSEVVCSLDQFLLPFPPNSVESR